MYGVLYIVISFFICLCRVSLFRVFFMCFVGSPSRLFLLFLRSLFLYVLFVYGFL